MATTNQESLDLALADLHDIGFDDATVNGKEIGIANGETRLLYDTEHTMDLPVLVRDADGEVRLEPWTYGFGFSDD